MVLKVHGMVRFFSDFGQILVRFLDKIGQIVSQIFVNFGQIFRFPTLVQWQRMHTTLKSAPSSINCAALERNLLDRYTISARTSVSVSMSEE